MKIHIFTTFLYFTGCTCQVRQSFHQPHHIMCTASTASTHVCIYTCTQHTCTHITHVYTVCNDVTTQDTCTSENTAVSPGSIDWDDSFHSASAIVPKEPRLPCRLLIYCTGKASDAELCFVTIFNASWAFSFQALYTMSCVRYLLVVTSKQWDWSDNCMVGDDMWRTPFI